MFPTVTVAGSPYECGRQYGEQARDRVRRSIASYAELFKDVAGWDWRQTTTYASRFVDPIGQFGEQYVEELAGIADGADVAREDVVAINVRTEILSAARVKQALVTPLPSECTVVAGVTPDGRVLAGQNWDWMPFASDTVVVLRSEPDDGPALVTVVEAGLLAKFGVNSAGLALSTNALACEEDEGDPGVPYHVLLRAVLGCGSVDEAVGVLEKAERASSANYLLADSTGSIVDVEARPGDIDRLHKLSPDADGLLLHTNHFVSPDFDCVDYADLVMSTSHYRLERATEVVRATWPADGIAAALADHTNAPGSICRHPITSLPMAEQVKTVASGLIDLTSGRFALAAGPPCDHGFRDIDQL